MIRVDYTNACANLGQLRFQREVIEQQERQLMDRINQLAMEEAALPPEAKKATSLKSVPSPDGTA